MIQGGEKNFRGDSCPHCSHTSHAYDAYYKKIIKYEYLYYTYLKKCAKSVCYIINKMIQTKKNRNE